MDFNLKSLVKGALQKFDYTITHFSYLQRLEGRSKVFDDIDIALALREEHSAQLLKILRHSKSDLGQDLFVLSELNFKSRGYFVEFGATDGVAGSNSYLLEREFGWMGIVAEPARHWHRNLKKNRSCKIETDCVWGQSNRTIEFNEADWAELSSQFA